MTAEALSQLFLSIWLIATLLGIGLKINWSSFKIIKSFTKELIFISSFNLFLFPLIVLFLLKWIGLSHTPFYGIFVCVVLCGSPIAIKFADSKKQNIPFMIVLSVILICLSLFSSSILFNYASSFFNFKGGITSSDILKIVLPKVFIPFIISISLSNVLKKYFNAIQKGLQWVTRLSLTALVIASIFNKNANGFTGFSFSFYSVSFIFITLSIFIPFLVIKKNDIRFGAVYGTAISNTALCLMIGKMLSTTIYQATLQYALLAIIACLIFGFFFKRNKEAI